MGVQTFASGGKTEEIDGFPDYSGDGEITQKDVLIGRGVVPMQGGGQYYKNLRNGEAVVIRRGEDPRNYTEAELVAIGDKAENQLGFISNFFPDEYYSFYSLQQDPEATTESQERRKQFLEERPSTQEMIDRYKALEEAGVDPRTGPRSRFDDAAEEVERIQAARPDLETMSEYELSLLPLGQRLGQQAVETGSAIVRDAEELIDPIGPYTGAAVDEASDFLDVVTPPATSFLERATPDFIKNIPSNLRHLYDVQSERFRSETYPLFQQRMDQLGEFGDDVGEYFVDEIGVPTMDYLSRITADDIREFSPTVGNFFDDLVGNLDNVDGKVDTGAGQQTSSTTENNATRTDDSRATNLLQTPVGTIDVSGIIGSEEPVGYMEQAEEALAGMDSTQADVLENMQQLIRQTQDAAKQQAFNVGLLEIAGGIASGKPDLGLGSAAKSTGQILGRGEAAAAPIRAAAAQQPMTAMKDKVAALTNLARVEVSREQQRGLNLRSENSLKVAALRAAETAVEEGLVPFEDAEEMSEAVASAANQIYLELSGMYGSSPTVSGGMTRDVNPDTGRIRYGAESAR
jgi:hypothetical protein